MKNPMLNKKGMALYVVLGTILVVIVLANVILSLVLSHSRLTHHQITRIRAYYAGRAGMVLAMEKLRTGTWQANNCYCLRGAFPGTCTPIAGCGNYAQTINDNAIPYDVKIRIYPVAAATNPGANPPTIAGTAPITINVDYQTVP